MSHRRHIAPPRVTLALPCVALVLALLAVSGLALLPTRAQATTITEAIPTATSAAATAAQTVLVSIQQPATTIAADGVLRVTVAVTTSQPAEYLEVRLRLRSASGDLVYQKTQVRNAAPAGLNLITYEYDLSSLRLSPGRYPIEVRVLATGADPTTVTSRALLVDANARPLPVALVIRYEQTPSVGFDGAFAVNPAARIVSCETMAAIADLVAERQSPVALAIAPITLDEFARAAAGYETTAGATAAADGDVPKRYAAVLESLRNAATNGALRALDAPYALPDLASSTTSATTDDLARQWARADAVLASALGSSAASSTAYFGDAVTPGAVTTLTARNDSALLVTPGAVLSNDATAPTGCYALANSGERVFVADENLAASALSGPDAFYDAAFDHFEADAVVMVMDIGPGSAYSAEDVRRVLDLIDGAPWLVLSDIAALGLESDLATVTLAPVKASTAPSGYWDNLAAARTPVLSYVAAAGSGDADAANALRAVLMSESSLLAGEDGDWAGAALGLKAAGDAKAYVTGQFALIHLNIMDITLSGRHGDIPVTIVNDTGKTLTLTLTAESGEMSIGSTSTVLTVLPEENFVTIPVSLGNALSGDLLVSLEAGGLTITDTIVRVKASYIDRLATVGMVVIVLLGLLFYIYRRVRPAKDTAAGE